EVVSIPNDDTSDGGAGTEGSAGKLLHVIVANEDFGIHVPAGALALAELSRRRGRTEVVIKCGRICGSRLSLEHHRAGVNALEIVADQGTGQPMRTRQRSTCWRLRERAGGRPSRVPVDPVHTVSRVGVLVEFVLEHFKAFADGIELSLDGHLLGLVAGP